MRRHLLFLMLAGTMACARADGLADLRGALARAATATPIKAQVDARTWRRQGEGSDATEDTGQASVQAEDGARGLALTYGRDVLARIESEKRTRGKNPNVKTPTLSALKELSPDDVLPLVSAAATLQRMLDQAVWKSERADVYQGRPARVLAFSIPISTLSARDRRYAKKFDASFHVWIGGDGTPLASRLRQTVSGRAFLVVSFESLYEHLCVYTQAGERLLTSRSETHSSASGAGEKDERKVVMTLKLQPPG